MLKYLKLLFVIVIGVFLVSCEESVKKEIVFNDDNIQLTVSKTYVFELNQECSIKVSDDSIAIINGNELTGLKEGTTKVILTLNEDKSVTKEVTVVVVGKTKYNVDYDFDGGTCIDAFTTFEEDENPKLPIPEKIGYSFLGWYENKDKVETLTNKNYTLKAHWQIKTFTITFYIEEGVVYDTKTYNYGDTILGVENPVKESTSQFAYDFVKWDTEFTIATEDLQIHAIFEQVNLYKVDFYFQGKIITSQSVRSNERITEVDAKVLEEDIFKYQINGYYTDDKYTTSFSTNKRITENTNVYLKATRFPKALSCAGMKVSILGDSISTFYSTSSEVNSYYGGENEYYFPKYSQTVKKYTDTWWGMFLTETKTSLGINNSWSGSTCYNFGSESSSGAMNYNRINTLGEKGTPHMIIVFIGTNDNVNGFTEVQFKNAYNTMLNRINEKYPRAYVFCINLGYSAYRGYSYTEANRLSYNEIIKKACISHKTILIDITNVQNESTYSSLLGDNLHPNVTGMERIAQKVSDTVNYFFTSGYICE